MRAFFALALTLLGASTAAAAAAAEEQTQKALAPEDPFDKFCPARDGQKLTAGGRDFLLRCGRAIYFEVNPEAKDIKTCAASCREGSCVGAYLEKEGQYCQRAIVSPEDDMAALAPVLGQTTITVPTTMTVTSTVPTTITVPISITVTSTVPTTITVSTTSTSTSTQRETRSLYLDANGQPTRAPAAAAPVMACGAASEVWTLLGRRYGVYKQCAGQWTGDNNAPELGSFESSEACLEAIAALPTAYFGAWYSYNREHCRGLPNLSQTWFNGQEDIMILL